MVGRAVVTIVCGRQCQLSSRERFRNHRAHHVQRGQENSQLDLQCQQISPPDCASSSHTRACRPLTVKGNMRRNVLVGLRCASGAFSCSGGTTAVAEEAEVDVPGPASVFSGSVCLVEGKVATAPAPASASASSCSVAEGIAASSFLDVAIIRDRAMEQSPECAV